MNNKGQIFSMDLLLYLVLLSLFLAIIYFIYVDVDDYQRESFSDVYVEEKLDDISRLLIKSSGSPDNWEFTDSSKINGIGLKSINSSHISYAKIKRLKQEPSLIEYMIPEGMKCNICLYPVNNPSERTYILGEYTANDYKNIKVRTSTLLIDYGYEILYLSKNSSNITCPYNHNHGGDDYICRSFFVTKEKLDSGRYYVVTNTSTKYIISNTYNNTINSTDNNIKDVSNQIRSLVNDTNDTLYIHSNNSLYLVYDAYNNPENLKNLLNLKAFILEIKLYY